jgi:protein MpaA
MWVSAVTRGADRSPLFLLCVLVVTSGISISDVDLQTARGAVSALGTHVRILLGRSVRGRPIWAIEHGDGAGRIKAVVVGSIHGNETGGIQIVRRLKTDRVPAGVDLWLIESMNPDGVAAGTRQNADRVDLNRNFPWHWRLLGKPGFWEYSGPRPLSEPESRAVQAFLLRLHPALVLWYHQPLAVVDESGGNLSIEDQYADLVGLPMKRLPRYPGSAAGWVNHRFPSSTSMVVELPAGPPQQTAIKHNAQAVLALLRTLTGHGTKIVGSWPGHALKDRTTRRPPFHVQSRLSHGFQGRLTG